MATFGILIPLTPQRQLQQIDEHAGKKKSIKLTNQTMN